MDWCRSRRRDLPWWMGVVADAPGPRDRPRVGRLPVPPRRGGANKKPGGPAWPSGWFRRGAISACGDLRRAHVSRVRGAPWRARSQHGCDAGEADVLVHAAPAPSWSWRVEVWAEVPPRRVAEYLPRQWAVNTSDDVGMPSFDTLPWLPARPRASDAPVVIPNDGWRPIQMSVGARVAGLCRQMASTGQQFGGGGRFGGLSDR